MLVYGLVLTGVFGVVCILATICLFFKRNHLLIKSRDPVLLIAQNFGILLSCTTQTLYIGVKPNYSCDLYYFGSQAGIAFVALAMYTRIWRYCVQFHLALIRNKYRENKNLEKGWEQQHWFFRNKWAGSLSFARKFFFFTWWIWFIPAVPEIFLHNQYNEYNICKTYSGSAYVTLGTLVIFGTFAVIGTILVWGARDAFHIKTEIKALVIIWVIDYIIWIPFSLFSFPLQETLPSSFWVVIALYLTLCTNTLWPLFLVFRDKEMEFSKTAEGYKAFIDDLEFLPFRNAFFEFLATQFCQENLLFYEAVMDWKRLPANKRSEAAIRIRETFIEDTGLCQINIDSATRVALETSLQKDIEVLPNTAFDNALAEVLGNMHTNSYSPFKKKANLLLQ